MKTKFISLLMGITMLMGLMTVPANACTSNGPDSEVIPCDKVAENGYCDEKVVWYVIDLDGKSGFAYKKNPYYAEPAVTPTPTPQPTINPDLGGSVGGYHTDINTENNGLMPADEYLHDFAEFVKNQRGCNDIVDYETLTIEYVDKAGNKIGYKSVVDPKTNDMSHYGPDGEPLDRDYAIDWSAEIPFTRKPQTTSTNTPIETPKPEVRHFDDVAPDAWYADAVNTMAASGIIKGFDDGLFHPNDYVTTGQLATIIYRIAKNEDPSGKPVDGYNHWAAYAVYTLNRADWGYSVASPDRADDTANRGEAIRAIIALIGDAGIEGNYTQVLNYTRDNNDIPDWDIIADHKDCPVGHTWSSDYILRAYNYGIINGVDAAGTCNPNGTLTRAELCQMLYNAGLTQYTPAEMKDSESGYGFMAG